MNHKGLASYFILDLSFNSGFLGLVILRRRFLCVFFILECSKLKAVGDICSIKFVIGNCILWT